MPERRISPGRRSTDQPKPEDKRSGQDRRVVNASPEVERRAKGRRKDDPVKPRAEVEPNRSHLLHRKIGGKKR